MSKNDVRIALLDMNNNHPNQGMRNIKELSKAFQEQSEYEVSVDVFDVRYKNEMPNIEDFDISFLPEDQAIRIVKVTNGNRNC
jgi:hypothetical protein